MPHEHFQGAAFPFWLRYRWFVNHGLPHPGAHAPRLDFPPGGPSHFIVCISFN